MLYTQIQPQSFLDSGEEDFKGYFTIYGQDGQLIALILNTPQGTKFWL